MPAGRVNYLVVYETESQVYSTASEEIALSSPPPEGVSLDEKHVLFITYHPDEEKLSVHPLPRDKVLNAEIKTKKQTKKKEEQQ